MGAPCQEKIHISVVKIHGSCMYRLRALTSGVNKCKYITEGSLLMIHLGMYRPLHYRSLVPSKGPPNLLDLTIGRVQGRTRC
jgi:hypothetical protein